MVGFFFFFFFSNSSKLSSFYKCSRSRQKWICFTFERDRFVILTIDSKSYSFFYTYRILLLKYAVLPMMKTAPPLS